MRKEYDFSKGKRGAVISSPGKTRITIMVDNEVIEFFRAKADAEGKGYQTLINSTLRDRLSLSKNSEDAPVTLASLRQVLREELAEFETSNGSIVQK